MAINAENKGTQKELVPSGNYVARCYSMVHLGTSLQNIKGVDKLLNKVRISWELPTEMRMFNEEKGEQPMSLSKEYTLSMNEKSNLRKDLESWRGKNFTNAEAESFDVTKLLGKPCMINVIHHTSKNGNVYEKITSITTIPKGMVCPPQINKSFEFNFEEAFERIIDLPEWLQNNIKESNEYKKIMSPESIETHPDDDNWPNPNEAPEEDDDLMF